jgi:ribosomal protein L7Ae-like RNA K-turn-binding protein
VTSENETIFRKITSLLHFSLRSRNAVTGYNSLIAVNPKKIGLILIEKGTSESTIKKIIKIFPDTAIEILPEGKGPGTLTGKHGVKILGIKRSEFEIEIKKHLKSLEI